MTEVLIARALKAKCANLALACVEADVSTGPAPPGLEQALRAFEERIKKLADPRLILDAPAILATRAGYKALGKDPARYRGSAEALLRRVIAGKGLPRIHSVVDVINLVSAESRLPIGLYDLAKVEAPVEFRAGRAGETYKGIGKYDLNLEGLPLFSDVRGPHGSATSDSERTMVTAETKRVLAILVSFGGASGLEEWASRLEALLVEHCSAKDCETVVVG
jgi:DNA/RNA-binding domain of Phe-tRNA-synthetase-like protein